MRFVALILESQNDSSSFEQFLFHNEQSTLSCIKDLKQLPQIYLKAILNFVLVY